VSEFAGGDEEAIELRSIGEPMGRPYMSIS
jgi:hypothetical protein